MNTTYTDQSGSIKTTITNTFQEGESGQLFMNLDGVHFEGCSFDDFELVNPSSYSPEQLQRFTLNPSFQELCNCTLEFVIPTVIINKKQEEILCDLVVCLQLGKPSANGGIDAEMATFKLLVDNKTYEGQGGFFEMGLDAIKKGLDDDYKIKTCYGCQYADYSPYGQGFFGSMMCFKKQQQAYLELSNNFSKDDYFEVIDNGYILVQETYCCNQFEPRTKGMGYRG